MFCSKCGNNLAAGTAFCQVCGTAAATSTATPANASDAALSPAAPVSPHWLPPVTRAYGGFWLRFVAHLIDGLLLGAVFLAICIPVAMLSGLGAAIQGMARHNSAPDPATIAAFVSSIALLAGVTTLGSWLYYAYFESSDWQGTIGKKVMSLVVTDLNGNRISFARASGRFFAKIISGLIPLGIGYILAGVTEKKQAIHDMIASCLVLRS
jgi:uncharacterized RDD family membrane protein YckC